MGSEKVFIEESILKNAVVSVFFTIIIGLLSFIINTVFGRQLGDEALGLLRLFSQLIGYLSIAELGVGAAAISLLFKPLNTKDYKKVASILHTVSYFYNYAAWCVLIVGLLLNFALAFILNEVSIDIYIYWSLFVVNVGVTYIYAKYPILLSSDQRFGLVQKVKNTIKIFVQSTQIITLIYVESFAVFILLMIVGNLIEFTFYKFFYKKNYADLIQLGRLKTRDKALISRTWQVFFHKITGVIVHGTDYIIISKFIGLQVVAIYSSYMMIIQFVQLLINNVAQVITPRVGNAFVTKKKPELILIWRNVLSINCYMAAVIVCCMYVGLIDVVKLWMGESYSISTMTLILIIINVYINISRSTLDVFISASGYYKYLHLPVIEALVNLSSALILVRLYGLEGIITASIISSTLVVVLWKPILVYNKIIGINWGRYVAEFGKHIIFLLLSFYVTYNLNIYFNIEFMGSLFCLFIKMILSFIFITMLYFIDNNFRSIVLEGISKIKNKFFKW
ncbi:lipopolysaccharide biosynthesis protein [Aeromonas taiwanensis]|uniref:lipopolysaccharide biosynthesis protein n=1 Tax=Aeromonas taiwanensis TaxID=633417 RepID=UPI003F74636A